MLSLDDDEIGLALMALHRVERELERQIPGGASEGCSGAAHYVCQYAKPKIAALIARIEQYQQDEAGETTK